MLDNLFFKGMFHTSWSFRELCLTRLDIPSCYPALTLQQGWLLVEVPLWRASRLPRLPVEAWKSGSTMLM